MEYMVILGIILAYASFQTILFQKKIEQTIPISVVEIILIIYLFGLVDKLKLGVKIVEIVAIVNLMALLIYIWKNNKKEEIKKILFNIATPGCCIYIILCVISININKGRIFENCDEFFHWGKIIKNMYMYGTFGTNADSIISFNEYPPFTSIFQYLFITIHNTYSEDIIITAHNILYFSLIIQITKNIKWDKSFSKLILLFPIIIFLPMIFFENFYLEILVDGMIGIIFGLLFYNAQEDESTFKYLNIFSLLIALSLIKTTGIALAILAFVVILINTIINKNKKGIIWLIIIGIIIIALTSIWYVKIEGTQTRWDFISYLKQSEDKDEKKIAYLYIKAIFTTRDITPIKLTTFASIMLLIGSSFYTIKNKYYSFSMIVSVILYLIGLLLTYTKLFESVEANILACYSRYCSSILLAFLTLQTMKLSEIEKINIKKIMIMLALIIALLPENNIQEKYINSKTYIVTANANRGIITKIRNYKNILTDKDSILYITGTAENEQILYETNQYEIMPIKINGYDNGIYREPKQLEVLINSKNYTHVYIYRMDAESKENVKSIFEDEFVGNDILYKVIEKDGQIFLKREGFNIDKSD